MSIETEQDPSQRPAERIADQQKYLKNHDLRREILDAVGHEGSRERYSTAHRGRHRGFRPAELQTIARYVGAELLVPTRIELVAAVVGAVGIDATNRTADDRGYTRAGLKTLHRYVVTHPDSGDRTMCGQVRELTRQSSSTEVARQSDLSVWQATRHARGKCDCVTDVAPIRDHAAVSRSECVDWRRRVRHEGADRQHIADECDRRRTTVGNHVRGACGHDEDGLAEPPVEAYGGNLSLETCRRVRDALADGETSTALAEREGLPAASTIRKHGRGECRHDVERVGHPPVTTDGSGVVLDGE